MAFYSKAKDGYVLRVRLTPNSSLIKINGIFQNAQDEVFLQVSVISVPEKGKANKELIDFLSKKLDVAPSAMSVIFGQTDRFKKIFVTTNQNLDEKLEALIK